MTERRNISIRNLQFEQKTFNKLLDVQGIDLCLKKVSICPNRTSIHQESHNINCDMCDSGYIYYEDVEFQGVLQTSGLEKLFKDAGTWPTGTAMLTAPSNIRFDYFDKLEVPDAKGRFNQLIQRDSNSNIDKAHFKINEIYNLVDSNNKKYGLEADYTVNNQGCIEWISDNRPENGQIYTISYEYTPKFVVLDHLHFVRDIKDKTHKNMPQKVLVRIDYLTEFNDLSQGENE